MLSAKQRAGLNLPFYVFFLAFVITGLIILPDYGISWDEIDCRADMGKLNYEFIRTGNYQELYNNIAKYHGPAFELSLYGIEKLIGLKDTRSIFLMRHLVNFLVFAFSVFMFYRMCVKYLKSHWLAMLGAAMLVLSPRIFAHAFYNSKDLGFLSFVIMNICTTLWFLERKTIFSAVVHAIVSAFVIDIRIMGIIIPAFSGAILVVDFIRNPASRKRIIWICIIYMAILIAGIVAFWPVLWPKPLKEFVLALKEMSSYPWDGFVLYMGKMIQAFYLPWHYAPVWMLITTPVLYSILFVAGLYYSIKRFFKGEILSVSELLHLYVFFVPLLTVILLNAVIYDGWRHLYFIYPSLIFVALLGIKGIEKRFFITTNEKKFGASLLFAYLSYILICMILLHPYENIYFNSFAGKDLKKAGEKYEMDYWGLSYKEALERLLLIDTANQISVTADELMPCINNQLFLPVEDRYRINIVNDPELADYKLSCFRIYKGAYATNPVVNIVRDNAIIHSVYSIRNDKIDLKHEGRIIERYENNFEKETEGWFNSKIVIDSEFPENRAALNNSDIEYGTGISIKSDWDDVLNASNRFYITFDYRTKAASLALARVVLQIDTGPNEIYDWRSVMIPVVKPNTWENRSVIFKLPEFKSTEDIVKIYFWNNDTNEFLVDDIVVSISKVPSVDIKNGIK